MTTNLLTIFLYAFSLTLIIIGKTEGKPWAQKMNGFFDQPVFLDPGKKTCTSETENICQRCAKQTESPVVYPWCCANHEGAREWCENYLFYGLH